MSGPPTSDAASAGQPGLHTVRTQVPTEVPYEVAR